MSVSRNTHEFLSKLSVMNYTHLQCIVHYYKHTNWNCFPESGHSQTNLMVGHITQDMKNRQYRQQILEH